MSNSSLRKFFSLAFAAISVAAAVSLPARADDTAWKNAVQSGAEAYREADYGKAERMFLKAVSEAEKFGNRDLRLARSLTNLGVLYESRGQSSKSAPLYERAIAIKLAVLGPDNFDYVSSEGKLCQFYEGKGAHAAADKYAQRLLAYSERAVRDHQQMKANFKALSDFYGRHTELEEAEVMVRQAQDMTQKQIANQYLELAVLLDGLGNIYGSRPQAEQFYKLALNIREQSLSANHIALVSSHENLANRLLSEGRIAEAEPLFKQAYENSEKVLGAGKTETISRLDALAQCELKLGKTQEAESLYRHGLDICQKAYGNGAGNTGKMALALGNLLAKSGRYQEAAPLLAQALKSTEAMNGPQHASLSPILDTYADVLDKTNRRAEAKKLHARAKDIRG